jgi:hypothetical protein
LQSFGQYHHKLLVALQLIEPAVLLGVPEQVAAANVVPVNLAESVQGLLRKVSAEDQRRPFGIPEIDRAVPGLPARSHDVLRPRLHGGVGVLPRLGGKGTEKLSDWDEDGDVDDCPALRKLCRVTARRLLVTVVGALVVIYLVVFLIYVL